MNRHNVAPFAVISAVAANGGGGGTTNYNNLTNKPSINGVTLSGDKSPADIGAVPASAVGTSGGVAELDGAGKVLSAQLPSYVDDVLEYASRSGFPETGESGKIYVAIDTNLTYRWTGSAYTEISHSLALGETSSTAYRGDRGKTAYDHSQTISGNPHHVGKADVGLNDVANIDQSKAVKNITRSGTTFTATALDNSTFTFDQEDTTYSLAVSGTPGLSTNDYTDAEKAKLAGISANASGLSSVALPVTVSGDYASFNADAAGRTLNPLLVQINPVQAGTGNPSSTNIRAITGWTGANIRRTGKNLLPLLDNPPAGLSNYFDVIAYSVSSGSVTVKCKSTTPAQTIATITPSFSDIGLIDGQSYTITGSTGSSVIFLTVLGGPTSGSVMHITTTAGYTFVYDSATMGTWVLALRTGNSPDTSTTVTAAPMIRLAAEDSAFEPYCGQTAALSFPSSAGTVYGGTLDVARGLLTVTHACEHIDENHAIFTYGANFAVFRTAYKRKGYAASVGISSIFPTKSIYSLDESEAGKLNVYNGSTVNTLDIVQILIDGVTWSSMADVQTWLAAHPFDYVYPLATPITYTLTPAQVTTLLGTNHVWADCGPVSVTYPAGSGTPVLTQSDKDTAGGVVSWETFQALVERVVALEEAQEEE